MHHNIDSDGLLPVIVKRGVVIALNKDNVYNDILFVSVLICSFEDHCEVICCSHNI